MDPLKYLKFFACEQKNLQLNNWSKKIRSKKNQMLILLLKNDLEISNFEKRAETSRNFKRIVKKDFKFLSV